MKTLAQVTDKTFYRQVERDGEDVLVFCTADWSPACQTMLPILAEFAGRHPDIKVVTLDYDANPGTIGSLSVDALPAVVVFQGGTKRETLEGSIGSVSELENRLRFLILR